MSDVAIRVEGLGKRYRIGAQQRHDTLRDAIADFRLKIKDSLRPRNLQSSMPNLQSDRDFWALKDVSFEVKAGEVVGVIGRNGAGKSTLLKILSRITEPTEGRAEIHGRVGSLLEVGTGFHPELTGRENIFLNGAILGMRRTEIAAKFDEIVAFSEIERFLDTPVKRYSSGMYVRLAFAVAAHLEPEILLVDEVLAVGDAEFQKKCLGKMGDVAKGGKTVMFVSHNMAAIERLCERAILLRNGQLHSQGPSVDTISHYLNDGVDSGLVWERSDQPCGDVYIRRIVLVNDDGSVLTQVTTASGISVVIEYVVTRFMRDLQLTVGLLGPIGEDIFDTSPQDAGVSVPKQPGLYRAQVSFPANILLPKSYSLKVGFWLVQGGILDLHIGPTFGVSETASLSNSRPGGRVGFLVLPSKWTINTAQEAGYPPYSNYQTDSS